MRAYIDLCVLKPGGDGESVSKHIGQARRANTYRFLRLSLIESFEMVDKRVMSLTPACFFLKPSFQSA